MSNRWGGIRSWVEGTTRDEGGLDVAGYSGLVDIFGAHHRRSLSLIPDVDFDVNDPAYRRGLLLLAVVFVVAGVSTCLLLGCLVTWATRRRTYLFERSERPGRTELSKGRALLALAVLALAAEACVIGGLSDVERRLSKMENATQDIVAALRLAAVLPDRVNAALSGVATAYLGVQDGLVDCVVGFIINVDEAVEDLEEGVAANLMDLEDSGLEELANSIDDLNDDILAVRHVRHALVWPTVTLCAVLVGVYLFIAVKEHRRSSGAGETSDTKSCAAAYYPCASCDDHSRGIRKINCDKRSRWIRALTWVFAFVILLTAAVATTIRTMITDFCSDLDDNLDNVVEGDDISVVVDPVLDYYTGDCSGSTVAVDAIDAAQDLAADGIATILDILSFGATLCDDIEDDVELMDSSLEELLDTLDEGAELVSCENIGGLYRSVVWDELCGELPQGLMVLLVSCVLLFVFLLLLWVQWTFMLQQKREVIAGNGGAGGMDGSITPPWPPLPAADSPVPGREKAKVVSGYDDIPVAEHLSECGEQKQAHDYQDRVVNAAAPATSGSVQTDSPPPLYRPRNIANDSLLSMVAKGKGNASAPRTAADHGNGLHQDHHRDGPLHAPAATVGGGQPDSPPPPYRLRETVGDSLVSTSGEQAAKVVGGQPDSPPPPYRLRETGRDSAAPRSGEETASATGAAANGSEGRQDQDRQDGPAPIFAATEDFGGQPDSPPPGYRPG
ncbi:unnamed protein product [Scytosiphon promiscuus]